MAKQDDFVRYTIRVPEELYKRVAESAEGGGRSVNAEIIARLEASFDEQVITPDIEELIRETVLTAIEMPEIRQALIAVDDLQKARADVRRAAEERTGKSWEQLEREHAEKQNLRAIDLDDK